MRDIETNPLLGDLAVGLPFDLIRPAHVAPAVDVLIAEAQANLGKICAASEAPTWANTFGALDRCTQRLETAFGLVSHLESMLGDVELRAAYNEALPKISVFYSALGRDAALYGALQAFAATDAAQSLNPAQARFLRTTLDDFKRAGVALNAESKAQVAEIDVALSAQTTTFAQNVVDATDAFELVITDEAQLAGLPQNARDAAKAAAGAAEVQGWRFTLKPPSYLPVAKYLDDARVRETMYRAYTTRATSEGRDNRALVGSILTLRNKKARLLGYADVADLLLEPRMVKTGANARTFVDELRAKTEARFHAEHAELQAFRETLEGPNAPPIAPWDLTYYAEKQRLAQYDLDEEALRPYFEVEGVLRGMFALVGRLYGVSITPVSDRSVWQEQVRVYVLDDNNGTRLGYFYADLFPRDGKRVGAWMRPFVTGNPKAGVPHVALMAANATPPIGDGPALLTHREVETLFHEFGHLLHHLLTDCEIHSQAGTNVAWDFVELPSQIMENWCWHRAALDLFARHHETGEPIPEPLFERMSAARTFRAAYAQMRQLGFGTMDLALHRDYDAERDGDAVAFARAASAPFSPVAQPDNYAMIASFTHLFASPVGYAAAYYSYKWAEVLDADAFTRFEAAGLFSREVGRAFRDQVLARGDSADPAELYRAFMGRDPDQQPLLRRAGLA